MEETVSETAAVTTKELLNVMTKVGEGPIGLGNFADLAGQSRTFDYSFEYLNFLFAVKASADDRKTRMRFHANLGRIPYTSESGTNRRQVVKVVNIAGSMLGGKVQVSPEQRILLIEEFLFDEPLTPNLLLSKTVALLIRAKPSLELLGECIISPVKHRTFTSQTPST
jgi:hypothetical protein